MTLAAQHASQATSHQYWAFQARELVESGNHPGDRPAVFYKNFEDGSMVQVTVSNGEVIIEPGEQYDDQRAQHESEQALAG